MTSKVLASQADTNAESNARPGQKGEAASAGPSDKIAENSPTGLQVTDTWADAADQTGMVTAERRMPEPDSLGG